VFALVPADPLPPSAAGAITCVAAAGDAVAYLRRNVPQLDAAGQRLTLAPPGVDQACPTVAVAADGTAVAGFLAIPGDILSSSPRIVVRRPGGAFGPALGVGAPRNPAALAAPAVAAAPGGWLAAAWVQDADQAQLVAAVVAPDGSVRTSVLDTGPLFETGYTSPRIGIDSTGAALVAFPQVNPADDRDIAVLAVDRSAGTWSVARRLAAPKHDEADADVDNLPLATALAPDGRALVAWPVLDLSAGFDRILIATGAAGGWTRPGTLSLPTRESVGAPAAWVDAAGDPSVAWIEDPARLRAVRLVAGAQPDTTPPRLTATLPRTMRVNRAGIRPVRLSVRCDEACDVRAAVLVPGGDSVPEADAGRAVPAGRTVRITIRQQGQSFLPAPRPRHLRLRVIAADRAGNVAQRSRLVAVNRP
jgi:hypothetical protein